MAESILKSKSFKFALRILKLHQHLIEVKHDYTLGKQVYRSGTSIGAYVWEAAQAESRSDFIHKLGIAHKEAYETDYWLLLFKDGCILEEGLANSLIADCEELIKMLTASIKTAKANKGS